MNNHKVYTHKFITMRLTTIIIVIATLFLAGCKKNFEEINTNPNAPTNIQPGLLLRQVVYNYGDEMAYEGFVAGNLLSQHFTQIDFNLFDRHSLTETQFGGNPWPLLYRSLRDNDIVLKQSFENPIHEVYKGPSMILRAYFISVLTDIYGDVPYSEALQGNKGLVTPKYDSQESIYKNSGGILDLLDKGISAINSYAGAQALTGDILFNGDLSGWEKFANSLKIKALMRISYRDTVSGRLQNIFNEGNYIKTNAENATFDFTDGQPNNFRMANLRDGDFNLFIMSETIQEILNRNNDTRQAVLFRPFGNDTTGNGYNGLLNGPDASSTSISVADYSLTGTIFREATGGLDANFMTAWETEFFLAEAAERGLITSAGQTHYENGVALAFDYWNTPLPSTYLTTDSAAYGSFGQDVLEQIITQKWLANCINGYEGWIEYNRTGFPQLKTISASLNNDLIPTRMPYPQDEASLNAANYNAATAVNGNSINAKHWWDNN